MTLCPFYSQAESGPSPLISLAASLFVALHVSGLAYGKVTAPAVQCHPLMFSFTVQHAADAAAASLPL